MRWPRFLRREFRFLRRARAKARSVVTMQPTCSRDECFDPSAGLSHLCQAHAMELLDELDDLPEFLPMGLTPEQLEQWKREAIDKREGQKLLIRLRMGF